MANQIRRLALETALAHACEWCNAGWPIVDTSTWLHHDDLTKQSEYCTAPELQQLIADEGPVEHEAYVADEKRGLHGDVYFVLERRGINSSLSVFTYNMQPTGPDALDAPLTPVIEINGGEYDLDHAEALLAQLALAIEILKKGGPNG